MTDVARRDRYTFLFREQQRNLYAAVRGDTIEAVNAALQTFFWVLMDTSKVSVRQTDGEAVTAGAMAARIDAARTVQYELLD